MANSVRGLNDKQTTPDSSFLCKKAALRAIKLVARHTILAFALDRDKTDKLQRVNSATGTILSLQFFIA